MRLSEMRTEVTPQKINKIMERSFGFSIDYDNLSYAKAPVSYTHLTLPTIYSV